ncbi:hypothetical protein [Streptomyces sp. NPDC051684]|uniref:hypothetical protein n=1 Tax=Streptomyces sp. NPDC051684 TaxID=3365670 RepID=UPI0037AD4B1E
MTTEPLALLRTAEAYLAATHEHASRHDNLGADLTCGGCSLWERITATLAEQSAPAPLAPAGRTVALSETHQRMLGYALDLADDEAATDGSEITEDEQDALAELRRITTMPALADRAAVLREAAELADELAMEMRHGGGEDGDAWPEEWSSREVRDAVQSVAAAIRTLAAEAQQP